MNRPTFLMLCGLPCSGKSTQAMEFATEYDAAIFSSDALRQELFGDVNCQTRNEELFRELHKRIKDCLKSGKSAIYDACNVHYKERKAFLAELKNISCKKICIIMGTPYEECVRRAKVRERQVPEHVIKRMYMHFDPPWYYEGWDYIETEYAPNSFASLGDDMDWAEKMQSFNQCNPHHNTSLGDHCLNTRRYIDKMCAEVGKSIGCELRHAALLHDNGKPFTKTFKNGKGEITEIAHYYSHEHTGSYDSLFYDITGLHLYVAILIRWHMQPYFWEKDNNEKLHNKYRKLWGEDLYRDVMHLHFADKSAH